MSSNVAHFRLAFFLLEILTWAHSAFAVSPQNLSSLVSGRNDSSMSLWQGGDTPYFSPSIPLAFSGPEGVDNQQNSDTTDKYNITGLVRLTTPSNLDGLSSSSIAYVSCDPADYDTQLLQPSTFLISVLSHLGQLPPATNGGAVILYSKSLDWCSLDTMTNNGAIFTMISRNISTMLYNALSNGKYPNQTSWIADQKFASLNGTFQNSMNWNPANPTTTIAMIVLYSVTGIITFLFILIIVLGAVRAHRHPERYGPRNILGMPRQSRARGMARALLDTIPIVKFGENEQLKPAPGARDVELGDRNGNASTAVGGNTSEAEQKVRPSSAAAGHTADDSGRTADIAMTPADVPGADTIHVEPSVAAGPGPDNDAVQCPICTEDFVRGEPARHLPCDHHFHPACIDPWLLDVSSTCPLCRVDLNPPANDDTERHQEVGLNQSPNPSRRHRLSRFGFLDMSRASPRERIQVLRQMREEGGNRDGSSEGGSRRSRLSHFFQRNRHSQAGPSTTTPTTQSNSNTPAPHADAQAHGTNDDITSTTA